MFEYEYEKASYTVDIAVFRLNSRVEKSTYDAVTRIKDNVEILLIQRRDEPFKDCWCLPGGFINMDETLKQAAVRELREETGIGLPPEYLHSVGTYDAVDRDVRSRVITNAFWSFSREGPVAGDDAKDAGWFDMGHVGFNPLYLGFDHKSIAHDAYKLFCQTLNIRE
jgi:8-oxo-dGTP diphosphatase